MKILRTNKGAKILVDDQFYPELKKHKWWSHQRGYITTKFKKGHPREGERDYMHRMIMQMAGYIYYKGFVTDHINGNPLDNRLENLRIVTHQQNLLNSRCRKNKTSKYRGVSWYSRDSKWRAVGKHGGKHIHLGCFESEEEAARAYQEFVEKLHIRKDFMRSENWRKY